TGAHTVTVTVGAAHYIEAQSVSYTGVAQSGQPDASATATTQPPGPNLVVCNLTTIADECLVVTYAYAFPNVHVYAGCRLVLQGTDFSNATAFFDSYGQVSPPSLVATAIAAGNTTIAVISVSLAPFVASGLAPTVTSIAPDNGSVAG